MGINARHLKEYVIEPSLKSINMYSESACQLLLGTCAVESDMGTSLRQNSGYASGIFQIEEETYLDIISNYLDYRKPLKNLIASQCFYCSNIIFPTFRELESNLKLATMICRLKYYRVKEAIPSADDIESLGKYWKKYYNTALGKGKVSDFVEKYCRYVDGIT